MAKCGYVYIVQHGEQDLYKIGSTASRPIARVKDLQTGNPVELRIYEVIWSPDRLWTEAKAHDLVRKHRVRGEWFKLNVCEVDSLADILFWGDEAVHECETYEDLYNCQKQGLRSAISRYSPECMS